MIGPEPADLRRWGIDPSWSRHVDVTGVDGTHRWHVLDRHPAGDPATPTVVCLHGNPTWSYLWTPILQRVGPAHRIIAPDQLGMGYSDRPGPRQYAQRVRDLDDLLRALDVVGPVVLVAHDWGGAVAMGWAVDHPERVAGLVLMNTGIAVPAGRRAPGLVRLAARRGIHDLVTRRTSLFVRGTSRLPGHRLGREVREALAAPYRSAADREAIAGFVADIPFDDRHPSAADLADVAARLDTLDAPALLVWGAGDPVFDDDFADDLAARLSRVAIHRFASAGHLVPLEADVAPVVDRWLHELSAAVVPDPERFDAPAVAPLWSRLELRRHDAAVAFHDGAAGRSVTFTELNELVAQIGRGLLAHGVRPGDRLAVLTPPSVELVALVYACWRIGAVTVVADRGLGLRGLGRAIRGARVSYLVGPRPALVAARSLRWAPRARGIEIGTLTDPQHSSGASLPDGPVAEDPAAVLFTSGATGPAKGVRYTHGQLAEQRDALMRCYRIGPDDRLVAAFAPFALYGPALGIASAVPDVDVSAPGTLTATALDDACAAVGATLVFASPAALANVVATADGNLPSLRSVRTVMSAGAPVPIRTLRAMAQLTPDATLHTPYGMTESLPAADVDLATLDGLANGAGRGVCVGLPVDGCHVMVAPLSFDPSRSVEAEPVGITGEVLVRAPWTSAGYDRLWATERAARPSDASGVIWHRSGDVGHLDHDGRLWIEGRSVHVIHTVDGPVTPVPVEVAAETIDRVRRAAAVGVGPVGIQQVVMVVEVDGVERGRSGDRLTLADPRLAEDIRRAMSPLVPAAVCTVGALPVDIRHNAKIDRTALAGRVERLLAGGSA